MLDLVTAKRLEEFDLLPGWLHPDEGRLLYVLASKQPRGSIIVEVGSYKGKSTCFLVQAISDRGGGEIYAIDPHRGETGTSKKSSPSWKEFNGNIKKFGFRNQVKAIKKTSALAARGWTRPINLLNIDGLHDYESVRRDLSLWLPHLRDGGIVVCHDAFGPSYPGVMKAIRETIINSGDFRGGGVLGSQFFAIKGKMTDWRQRVNHFRIQWSLDVSDKVWRSDLLSREAKTFVVFVLLKILYINMFSFKATLRRYLRLPVG